MAPTKSAFAANPHSTHRNCAWVSRFAAFARPHCGTFPTRIMWRHRDEDAPVPRHFVVELTAKLGPPLIEDRAIQARIWPGPEYPYWQPLPRHDLDMFRTCRSSRHAIAWFLLMAVVALCR